MRIQLLVFGTKSKKYVGFVALYARNGPSPPPNSQAGPTPTSLTPWRAHRVTGRVEAACRVEEVPGA